MFSYKYSEDTFKRFFFDNAKEMGRLSAQCMYKWPDLYKQFMEGFYDEYLREHGSSERGPDKEGSDTPAS